MTARTTRHLLPPGIPLARTVARHLATISPSSHALDLSDVLLVAPTRRSARLIEGALIDLAHASGRGLIPPDSTTPAALPDHLLDVAEVLASPTVQSIAWAEAIVRTDRETLVRLKRFPPEPADTRERDALATSLADAARTLAAHGLRFADAAELDPERGERWRAAASIHDRYLALLSEVGRADADDARLRGLAAGRLVTTGRVVLACCPDLSGLTRRVLEASRAPIDVLIAAHTADATTAAFDDLGVPCTDHFLHADIPLNDDDIRTADAPDDQAAAALEAVAEAARAQARAPRDIAVGLLDAGLGPTLARAARRHRADVRDAAGLPLAHTSLPTLLRRIADICAERTLDTLAQLARHPAMERRIGAMADSTLAPDWLARLDDYVATTLHVRIDGSWRTECPKTRAALDQTFAAARRLLDVLEPDAGAASPTVWAGRLRALLATVYEDEEVSPESDAGRVALAATQRLADLLAEWSALPDGAADLSAARWSAPEALEHAAASIEAHAARPPAETDAVEMLGWLELLVDPAPVKVLVGVNERHLPTPLGVHPLIPSVSRARLGLPTDEQREARDAYLLATIGAHAEHVMLVVGRRSLEGDPLLPSRLLFRTDDEAATRRLTRILAEAPDPARRSTLSQSRPAPATRAVLTPRPGSWPALERMRVTAFRTWLASPYAFFLEHILGRAEVASPEGELDAMAFGSLVHDALNVFHDRKDLAEETDDAALADALGEILDTLARGRLGDAPPTACWIQIQQARFRLRAFARLESKLRRQGWRTLYSEWSPAERHVVFEAPSGPVRLAGRIDRIDHHAENDSWRIIDYKTGETVEAPDKAHRRAGEWADLQLPLYVALADELDIPADRLELGYIALPKQEEDVAWLPAEWDAEDLASAHACARDVIDAIRAQELFTPGQDPPDEGPIAAMLGRTVVGLPAREVDP